MRKLPWFLTLFAVLSSPTARAATLGAGLDFACAIENGEVYCWGDNYYGQLGNGQTDEGHSTHAVAVIGIADAVALAVGEFHACALRGGGGVLCWGRNDDGQLGAETVRASALPVSVDGLQAVVEIAAGGYHSCARRASGEVLCWGNNDYGALGDGTRTSRSTPAAVPGLCNATQLAAGARSQCALCDSGTLACWGDRSHGQLGDGFGGEDSGGEEATLLPVEIPGIDDAQEVVRNSFEGCALHATSTVSCWGWNHRGGVGDGTTRERTRPVLLGGVTGATDLWARGSGFCARRSGGQVLCWGANEFGELGDGRQGDQHLPTRVAIWENGEPMDNGDGWFGCVRRPSAAIECWGRNASGQLGNGNTRDRSSPSVVSGLPSHLVGPAPVVQIEGAIQLHVVQRGQTRAVRPGLAVDLDRAPFTLVLRFRPDDGIFVNASHQPDDGWTVEEGGSFAEGRFNPDQTLYLHGDGQHYWYYHDDDDHRFDGPCAADGESVVCQRTVKTLSYEGGDATPIRKLGQDKLYLDLASKQGYCATVHVELRFR